MSSLFSNVWGNMRESLFSPVKDSEQWENKGDQTECGVPGLDSISLIRVNSEKTWWGKQKNQTVHDTIKTKSEAKSRVFCDWLPKLSNKCWILFYQETEASPDLLNYWSSFWFVRQQFLWNGNCNFIDKVQDFVHSRQQLRSATSGHTERLYNLSTNCKKTMLF